MFVHNATNIAHALQALVTHVHTRCRNELEYSVSAIHILSVSKAAGPLITVMMSTVRSDSPLETGSHSNPYTLFKREIHRVSNHCNVHIPERNVPDSPARRRKTAVLGIENRLQFLFWNRSPTHSIDRALQEFTRQGLSSSDLNSRISGLDDILANFIKQIKNQHTRVPHFSLNPGPRSRATPSYPTGHEGLDEDNQYDVAAPTSPTLLGKHVPESSWLDRGEIILRRTHGPGLPTGEPSVTARPGDPTASFVSSSSTVPDSTRLNTSFSSRTAGSLLTTAVTSFASETTDLKQDTGRKLDLEAVNDAPLPLEKVGFSWSTKDLTPINLDNDGQPGHGALYRRTPSTSNAKREKQHRDSSSGEETFCGRAGLVLKEDRDKASQKPRIVQHQIAKLPYSGFGINVVCPPLAFALGSHKSFEWVIEQARIKQAISDIGPSEIAGIDNVKSLHSFVERNIGTSYSPSPDETWAEARSSHTSERKCLMFRSQLHLRRSNEGPLIETELLQTKKEKTGRVQRKFGWDRFMYCTVPPLDHGFAHITGSDNLKDLREAFLLWMLEPKELLGRTWQAFHLQQVSKKRNQAERQSVGRSFRVVFFATKGHGVSPISLADFLDWNIPFQQNLQQTLCKAFARLDLAVSSTTPAIDFSPSQVRFVEDVKPDGTPENAEFNDPNFEFDVTDDVERVMTDGCGEISPAAAEIVMKLLGIEDKRAAIQARINGAKGVWMISAPYDSNHRLPWINIRDSQQKVNLRPEDKDVRCEAARFSFDVVKCSHPAKSAELIRDFFPILEDRGVPRSSLAQFVKERLTLQTEALEKALDDPVALRLWINQHNEHSRESSSHSSYGLPRSSATRVTYLLEAGFHPRRSKILADAVYELTQYILAEKRKSFRISCSRSVNIIGIADPRGVLRPGEIHLSFSDPIHDDQTGSSWTHLTGEEVLVTRSPTLRASDMQKVRAVFKPELAHLMDVVVFPVTGQQPLADKLQGGDYDGDTFWVCWEPDLTKPFRNAPCLPISPASAFNIEKDSRTIRDISTQGTFGDSEVREWLEVAFKSAYEDSLLPMVTNYYYKLSYHLNSLHDKKVKLLADLHDHLIDAKKNGYSYNSHKFSQWLRSQGLPQDGELEKPLYKKESPGKKLTVVVREPKRRRNKHILDHILFEVIDPHIARLLDSIQKTLEDATTRDFELEYMYNNVRTSIEHDPKLLPEIKEQSLFAVNNELNALEGSQKDIALLWARKSQAVVAKNGDLLEHCVKECFERFQSLQPKQPQHPLVSSWLNMRTGPNSPSYWDLLKASALAAKFHKNHKFIFHVAGRLLCELKAAHVPSVTMTASIAGIMKPKRPRERAVAAVQDDFERDSDTSEDYGLDDADVFDHLDLERM